MTKTPKTGWRTGIVLSLTAAALVLPEMILAGPGCMNNQRMARGYYPHSPAAPQMAYGQRAPYPYYAAPGPYAGMMPAAPSSRPMMARQRRTATDGVPVVQAAVASGAGQPTGDAGRGKSTPAGETVTVHIDGMRFEPATITVKPGTTVTWVHGSQMPHAITGNDDGLRSSTLYKGQKYSHTFKAEGLYNYFCDLHPSMRGNVVVEEAGTGT